MKGHLQGFSGDHQWLYSIIVHLVTEWYSKTDYHESKAGWQLGVYTTTLAIFTALTQSGLSSLKHEFIFS